MHNSIRTVVLGLLLTSGATVVQAQDNTPTTFAIDAAAAPPPLDLSLRSAATGVPSSLPLDPLQTASGEVRSVARWVVDSRDNGGLPFLLIDKVNARAFAFSAAGQLRGDAPVLLGMARGDRLIAPNGATMAQMGPQERITPAGRFVSRLARDWHGKELLVLDYEASISLHPVLTNQPKERRVERLDSPTALDNRISFGCINVPPAFYANVVSTAFAGTKGIVYVLPEMAPASAFFAIPPVGAVVAAPPSGPTALDAGAAASASPVTGQLASPGAQN